MSGDWSALEAQMLDAELFVHSHSPQENAGYAEVIGCQLATARAAYTAARQAGDYDAAVAAAVEWADLAQIAGVVADGLKNQQRLIRSAPFRRAGADRQGGGVYLIEWPE